ncbi:MAG: GNAT family N-acetyltransferase [Xanthobacteraceae bacterium]|nr:GNAT family N-acetyltransferase [Xanthobacteraceae bacterium]
MIRSATLTDIESITDIYNEAILEGGLTGDLEPLSADNRLEWYLGHQERYTIFVKVVDAAVVGYVAISPYRKGRDAFSEICEISYYVARKFRGRGLGKELVLHAIEYARRSDFASMLAMVLGCNQRSIDFLIGFGFSVLGRLPNAARIDGEHVDHVYLTRSICP